MKGISLDVANLQWSERNARMRRLLQKSSENIELTSPDPISYNSQSSLDIKDLTGYSAFTVNDHGTSMFMEFDLLKAATKDDVDGFIDVLERVSTEKQLPVRVIFSSVSLSGNTLLHVAASNGNANMVKLILYHFPSLLSKENYKGDTAMHIAAKTGNTSVLWAIIHLRNEFSNSLSPIYCGLADTEVELEDVSLKVRNEKGNTPLQEALINHHPLVAEQLVKADGEVSYFLNKEEKSALYLAAEAGYVGCIEHMLEDAAGNGRIYQRLKGKSPVHAAVMGRHKEALTILLEREPKFIHSRDEQGRTSLHCAASIGYLEGVRYLIGKYTPNFIELDDNGLLPIHLASMKGYVNVIVELLLHYHDPNELLNSDDQNILHIAAKYGKYNVVRYVLRTPELKKLINEKDKDGNTPLHLASIQRHPKIVSALTWDERVNLRLINNEGFTALDAAMNYMLQDTIIPFRKRLTWSALTAAGASRASPGRIPNAAKQASMQSKPLDINKYKDRVNTLLLVSTLVATVTYAAGFTMPGGNSDSGPNEGMATMLKRHTFHIFVLCDTIAMYSAIAVVVTLIWAQLGDLSLVAIALRLAIPFLGFALTMMSLAFMAGVYLAVSKLNWLANAVLVMDLIFIIIVAALFFPLCFPVTSSYRIFRYLTFYLICLATLITGSSHNEGNVK